MCVRAVVLCLLFTWSVLVSGGQGVEGNASADGNWPQQIQDKKGDGILEALLQDKCYGRKCSSTEPCCPGTVCVHIEGDSGTCLPLYGKDLRQSCFKDSDCGEGLLCASDSLEGGLCFPDGRSNLVKKGFNDECFTSDDCDAERNLCCQVMRRHRMAPKRLCHYFLDPKSCIGEVRTTLKEIKYVPNPYFKARLG